MNNKNISSLLNESIEELKIPIETISEECKSLNIVEFLQEYTDLSNEDIYDLGSELLEECPSVVIVESALGAWANKQLTHDNNPQTTADDLKNLAKGTMRGAYNAAANIATGGDRTRGGNSAQPTNNIINKIGNVFGTKGSDIRNAPMFKVVDPQTRVASYFAFPDLDLTRPGHSKILQDLMSAEQQKTGGEASIVDYNSGDRAAATTSATTIRFPAADQNSKQAVVSALANLQTLITKEQQRLNAYGFISTDELTKLKQDVVSQLGTAEQASTKSENNLDPATVIPAALKQMDNAPASSTVTTPTARPGSSIRDAFRKGYKKSPAAQPEALAAQDMSTQTSTPQLGSVPIVRPKVAGGRFANQGAPSTVPRPKLDLRKPK